MEPIVFRLFAAARDAAGASQVELQSGPIPQALEALRAGRSAEFGRVLGISSLVCAGERIDPDSDQLLPPGAVLDVLPPFAGG